jgi:2-aminobenzoate-CoA ligase
VKFNKAERIGMSAHKDTFTADNLPNEADLPEFLFDLPELQYPDKLNAAVELIDKAVSEGYGDKIAIYANAKNWTYSEISLTSNQIANVLVNDYGLVSGNRVLIRGPNNPMMAMIWLAALKAGAVAVATMPLLRASELETVIDKAKISHALCDIRLLNELDNAAKTTSNLKHNISFGDGGELDEKLASASDKFKPVETSKDDVALLAFTSGTTGNPKATMHFHRDVLAMADTFCKHILKPSVDDVFAGTPPIAFTFGLGAVIVFPLRARASTVLDETPSPKALLEVVEKFKVSMLFTAPTAYRVMLDMQNDHDTSSLVQCISAGEALPEATSNQWFDATGIRLVDGIGATEMIHIFISAGKGDVRPGATGKPVPGYIARVQDTKGVPLGVNEIGFLAVKGPTGCRYLDDARQKKYVQNGWNITGDAYRIDEDGYFWFEARMDDIIISGGYNISGPEVENALLKHEVVSECAVVSAQDEQRGNVVKAYVVLKGDIKASQDLIKTLQNFVKETIAPYKYPRIINFTNALPKTQTGKIQRFKLRQTD